MSPDHRNQTVARLETAGLTPGERALVGAWRGWRAARRFGGLGVVLHAVKGAGLPVETALPLAGLLGTLDAAAVGGGALRRPLDADEATLLDALAAAQRGDAATEAVHLRRMFPAATGTAAAIAEKLHELAVALRAAGVALPGGRSIANDCTQPPDLRSPAARLPEAARSDDFAVAAE